MRRCLRILQQKGKNKKKYLFYFFVVLSHFKWKYDEHFQVPNQENIRKSNENFKWLTAYKYWTRVHRQSRVRVCKTRDNFCSCDSFFIAWFKLVIICTHWNSWNLIKKFFDIVERGLNHEVYSLILLDAIASLDWGYESKYKWVWIRHCSVHNHSYRCYCIY